MIFECPGSHRFKKPHPETLDCPFCGEEVELWSDEAQAICPKCKKIVARQLGEYCLDWCKYAKECVGQEIYDRYKKNKKGGK